MMSVERAQKMLEDAERALLKPMTDGERRQRESYADRCRRDLRAAREQELREQHRRLARR